MRSFLLTILSVLVLAVPVPGVAQQGVPAPGTMYSSGKVDGFPKGFRVSVVLCGSEGRNSGRLALYLAGQSKANIARDAKKGGLVLRSRIGGKNLFLDVTKREVMWGKYVAAGKTGRVPVEISLLGPITKPC